MWQYFDYGFLWVHHNLFNKIRRKNNSRASHVHNALLLFSLARHIFQIMLLICLRHRKCQWCLGHAIYGSHQDTVGALYRGDERDIGNQYVSQDKLILSSGKPDKCAEKAPRLIRCLTPLECERLQGFPDGWTDLPGASNSARYKALGNSIAIPCVEFILWGICAAVLYG